jgi:hypothetical protein
MCRGSLSEPRLIYYAMTNCAERCSRQWLASIRSLRHHNVSIPVHLVVYDEVPPEIGVEAQRTGVTVHPHGDYARQLERMYARGSILARNPTFPKVLALAELATNGTSQILYVDCDTFFFRDPVALFDRYADRTLYAREEPCPSNLDEKVLGEIRSRLGLRTILPFNSGVCLFNHRVWTELVRLRTSFLDFAWRLLVGRHAVPAGKEPFDELGRAILDATTWLDRHRALPYPSDNDWIVEQIALWLTLGRARDVSQGFFEASDVAQGGETLGPALHGGADVVVGHYYSHLEDEFFRRLRRRR